MLDEENDLFSEDDSDEDAGRTEGYTMVWNAMSAPNDRSVVADHRRVLSSSNSSVQDMAPQMQLPVTTDVETMTEIDYFLHFVPKPWMLSEMIPAMNATAEASSDSGPRVTFEDIMVLLGVLMYYCAHPMETFRNLWSRTVEPTIRRTPHQTGEFISRSKCERLMRLFGCLLPAEREDDVHPIKGVLKMIEAFNEHFRRCFIPGWVTCLGESTLLTPAKTDPLKV